MKQHAISKKWMTTLGLISFGLIIIALGIYATTSVLSIYVIIPLVLGVAGALAFWIFSALISRTARYGSNVAIMIFLAFVILILINFVSARNFKRYDTTKGKQFSLSQQTLNILNDLEQEIKVTAFYTEDHYRSMIARDLLNEYAMKSDNIKLEFIDPNIKPSEAIAYGIKRNGTVVFQLGDKREDVESHQNEEQDFTSAILKLLSTDQKKVCFLYGHGERDIDGVDDAGLSKLKELIEADNYLVDRLILAGKDSVSTDCDVLVIAGPQKPIMPGERDVIDSYLRRGGKAIIMVEPEPAPSLSNLLSRWGVEVRDDVILDRFSQANLGDPSIPVTVRYTHHPITDPLSRVMIFFPMSRSVASKTNPDSNLEVIQLVKASDSSWGEVNTDLLLSERRAEYNEAEDFEGPMSMAAVVIHKSDQGESSEKQEKRILAAFGDSDFVTNNWLQEGNPDFFMNTLNWLTEEEELISIRPKDQELSRIRRVTSQELTFVTYFSIFAIPLLVLIAGGFVWWKRR
ncbi:hypothetical protein GF312_20490 [Candidatus Poribacteria bacterium]|nr:hypothetical protein [Candidatus Poribacteria bacterium]